MARVVVWGTGNVGRPAIRAVAAHRDLDLAGVIVATSDKVGVDAGALAGLEPLGVAATDDIDLACSSDVDAVVYTVNSDFRPVESQAERPATTVVRRSLPRASTRVGSVTSCRCFSPE